MDVDLRTTWVPDTPADGGLTPVILEVPTDWDPTSAEAGVFAAG